jgi:U3 small nucleolar RNA-associated protein 14
MNRRDVLTVGGLTLSTTLTGCFSVEQNESEGQTDGNESGSSRDDTEPTPADDDSELDLREANVVSVVVDDSDGASTFTVGLHHDDAGEDGYANWWQVETLDGTQLGRRDLLHAHENNQPFERSETIEIPDDVTCVVVRGHDQTHGYGGRAVVVNLDSGGQNAIQQRSERQTVSESDCPE